VIKKRKGSPTMEGERFLPNLNRFIGGGLMARRTCNAVQPWLAVVMRNRRAAAARHLDSFMVRADIRPSVLAILSAAI